MMKPDDVAKRIAMLQEAIKRGDRSTMTPNDEMDTVGRALAELQKILLDLLGEFKTLIVEYFRACDIVWIEGWGVFELFHSK